MGEGQGEYPFRKQSTVSAHEFGANCFLNKPFAQKVWKLPEIT